MAYSAVVRADRFISNVGSRQTDCGELYAAGVSVTPVHLQVRCLRIDLRIPARGLGRRVIGVSESRFSLIAVASEKVLG